MNPNINPDYQEQIQAMHQGGKFNNGAKQFKLVRAFLAQYQPRTLLDFGCGKGALIHEIALHYPDIECRGYDPGMPEFSDMPANGFDAVVSTDAFEHIEPEHLEMTLALVFGKMLRCGFFRIACYPAKKHLPDGRNCHLIVESPDWWRQKVQAATDAGIVWERVEQVDKSDKWPQVKGHTLDIILERK